MHEGVQVVAGLAPGPTLHDDHGFEAVAAEIGRVASGEGAGDGLVSRPELAVVPVT